MQGEEIAPIDLDDAQIGNSVKSQQVQDLPLILRDPYQLILLSPGAIQGNFYSERPVRKWFSRTQ